MTTAGALLEIRSLVVEFGAGPAARRVLDGVDLTVRAGECVGLAGPSGSGKTTLARACLGLLPPAARLVAGTLRFRDMDLTRAPDHEWCALRGRQIAYLPQEPASSLDPVRRVGWQVCETMAIHGLDKGAAARKRALETMARVGLDEPERLWYETSDRLSGGQRQRVALAAALAAGPALLIADEPTTALDASLRLHVLDLFGELRRTAGLAVVLVSHDRRALERAADRVVQLPRPRGSP